MTDDQLLEIVMYCDKLTENGSEFAVSWSGGGDSGFFQIEIDDNPVEEDTPINLLIIDLVDREVGYGSFAGDFSAEGRVVYNRETKCFEGTDNYSMSTSDTRECAIQLLIPKDIWFDQIHLQMEGDEGDINKVVSTFIINNGPRIDDHGEIEASLNKIITEKINAEISQMDRLDSAWLETALNVQDFETRGDHLVAVINEFGYSYDDVTSTDIEICLTDSINDHEAI